MVEVDKVYKGYSMVELLVVMIVIVTLTGLGFTSVRSFRSGFELNSASQEFESIYRTAKNNARNNVAGQVEDSVGIESLNTMEPVTNAFALYFGGGDIELRSCSITSTTPLTYNCSTLEPARTTMSDSISISGDACNGILFTNRTADVNVIQVSNLASFNSSSISSSSCSITLTHDLRPSNEIIYLIDPSDNSITRN